jgi:N-alpha-acetyltransferase 50
LTTVDIKYGELTDKNVEQFRILNYLNLPVVYSEDFYIRLINYTRYSKLAYLKDVLVGAISCKEEQRDGVPVVYIMTITVLNPYRRYGIGSQLLEKAIEECAISRKIKKMYLHV